MGVPGFPSYAGHHQRGPLLSYPIQNTELCFMTREQKGATKNSRALGRRAPMGCNPTNYFTISSRNLPTRCWGCCACGFHQLDHGHPQVYVT